jgi:hypothetical protein
MRALIQVELQGLVKELLPPLTNTHDHEEKVLHAFFLF